MPVLSGWNNISMLADLNCDMGEGIGNDALLIPYISSANIACGYHAGDAGIIYSTIELCLQHQVAVGAHPSFFDRENFGRQEMNIPAQDLYELVTQQLLVISDIAATLGTALHHVKPHGALYNMSARDAGMAKVIAKAVKDVDSHLVLFGLSGSHSISEAKKTGLRTASEVFADRMYSDDGFLSPRSQPGALISDPATAVQQVLQMIREGTVTTFTGKKIPVAAETICIHGDGKQAVEIAKTIHKAISAG